MRIITEGAGNNNSLGSALKDFTSKEWCPKVTEPEISFVVKFAALRSLRFHSKFSAEAFNEDIMVECFVWSCEINKDADRLAHKSDLFKTFTFSGWTLKGDTAELCKVNAVRHYSQLQAHRRHMRVHSFVFLFRLSIDKFAHSLLSDAVEEESHATASNYLWFLEAGGEDTDWSSHKLCKDRALADWRMLNNPRSKWFGNLKLRANYGLCYRQTFRCSSHSTNARFVMSSSKFAIVLDAAREGAKPWSEGWREHNRLSNLTFARFLC